MSEILEKKVEKEVPTKVIIKQFRKNGWLEPGHDGEFQYTNTTTALAVQRDKQTGVYLTGLTEEDEKRLENTLGLETGTLSRSNRKGYWDQDKFKIEIPKGGKTLHPKTNPVDEITWKVALVHQEIANSEAEKTEWAFAKYVMTSVEEETRETNKIINLKTDAFAKFVGMSEDEMRNFLLAYGKGVDKGANFSFIKAQVGKIVDAEPQTFLELVNSTTYKAKVFLRKLISAGIIRESGGKYSQMGGEVIGYSFEQTVDFLMNPDNQGVALSLKGQLSSIK